MTFVDDGLFISQEKSYEKSNINLIISSYPYLASLVSLLSITNWKCFTSWDWQRTSTHILWIYIFEKVLFFVWKIHSIIWDSSLTRSSCFINTFITILTKSCPQSRAWKCWAILQEDYLWHTNNYSTEHVSFSLLYMDFSSGISKEHYFISHSRNWRKCKKEWPYGSQKHFAPY